MKVLRVLQSGEFERLGSSETRRVEVRVLAATNADLRQAIRAGRFREDLFFRLNVIELAVPPLRERKEDILPLADTFLRSFSAGSGGGPRTLSAEARAALVEFAWPGNVRELMNRIQRATLIASGSVLGADDLGLAPGASLPAPDAGGRRTAGAERLRDRAHAAGRRRQRVAGRGPPRRQPPGPLSPHGEAGDRAGAAPEGVAPSRAGRLPPWLRLPERRFSLAGKLTLLILGPGTRRRRGGRRGGLVPAVALARPRRRGRRPPCSCRWWSRGACSAARAAPSWP